MKFILIISLLLVFHAYFGYPLTLWLVGLFRSKSIRRQTITPPVTLLITAYNEATRIEEKLRNSIALDYPKDKLQILVASDGSDDGTNDMVRAFENDGVELFVMPQRSGKESTQKAALEHATGEVIVFTDVATRIPPDGLSQIVSNFADTTVGCVSSEDRLVDKHGEVSGEGFYVKYEMALRRIESRVNTLVGLSGSFFAARRDVCQNFSAKMQSDFRTLLTSVQMGYRGVTDPEAIGYYQNISDEKREYARKLRTVVRGLTVFFDNLYLLNIKKYGLFSYQLFCHKLLRWLVPFFLIFALLSNLLLIFSAPLFFILFLMQAAFYGFAAKGLLNKGNPPKGLAKIPMFFVAVNLSILDAWWHYLRGKRIVMWQPSDR